MCAQIPMQRKVATTQRVSPLQPLAMYPACASSFEHDTAYCLYLGIFSSPVSISGGRSGFHGCTHFMHAPTACPVHGAEDMGPTVDGAQWWQLWSGKLRG